jgi:hypothetical protein
MEDPRREVEVVAGGLLLLESVRSPRGPMGEDGRQSVKGRGDV